MKVILTTTAIILFTTFSFAQDSTQSEKEITTNAKHMVIDAVEEAEVTTQQNQIARLYMFKNSRIKKELAFRTKRNKSKLA